MTRHLYDQLIDLNLRICCRQLPYSFNLFSTWINPSHLITLALSVHIYSTSVHKSVAIISNLLERAGNLRTLKISYQRGHVCRIQRVSRIHRFYLDTSKICASKSLVSILVILTIFHVQIFEYLT